MDTRRFFNASFERTQRPLTAVTVDLSADISGRMLALVGDSLYVDQASTGIATIELQNESILDQVPLLATPGMQIENHPYTAIKLSCAAQPGKILRLIAAVESRIKSGVPYSPTATLDGGKVTTLADGAFWANASCAAGVGLYSHVQLWNPAASTKNLIVTEMGITVGGTGGCWVRSSTTQLANSFANPRNKRMGAGVSPIPAVMQWEQNAATLGQTPTLASLTRAAAGDLLPQNMREPIVIPPQTGLLWVCPAVNMALTVNAQYTEEPV